MPRHGAKRRYAARQQQIDREYFLHTIPSGIEQQGIALAKSGWLLVQNPNSRGALQLDRELATRLRDALDKLLAPEDALGEGDEP